MKKIIIVSILILLLGNGCKSYDGKIEQEKPKEYAILIDLFIDDKKICNNVQKFDEKDKAGFLLIANCLDNGKYYKIKINFNEIK